MVECTSLENWRRGNPSGVRTPPSPLVLPSRTPVDAYPRTEHAVAHVPSPRPACVRLRAAAPSPGRARALGPTPADLFHQRRGGGRRPGGRHDLPRRILHDQSGTRQAAARPSTRAAGHRSELPVRQRQRQRRRVRRPRRLLHRRELHRGRRCGAQEPGPHRRERPSDRLGPEPGRHRERTGPLQSDRPRGRPVREHRRAGALPDRCAGRDHRPGVGGIQPRCHRRQRLGASPCRGRRCTSAARSPRSAGWRATSSARSTPRPASCRPPSTRIRAAPSRRWRRPARRSTSAGSSTPSAARRVPGSPRSTGRRAPRSSPSMQEPPARSSRWTWPDRPCTSAARSARWAVRDATISPPSVPPPARRCPGTPAPTRGSPR